MTEKYNPFVIAIRFGDNDFYTTFMDMLTILQSVNYSTNDREKLLKTINELSYTSYRLKQNNFEYDNGYGEEANSKHIKEYLTIRDSQLIMGYAEVDKYVLENPWDNSETFVLDTRLPKDQQVYCI